MGIDFKSPEICLIVALMGRGGGDPNVNGQCPLKKTEIVYQRPLKYHSGSCSYGIFVVGVKLAEKIIFFYVNKGLKPS